jgi:hypothetical protein
MSPRGVRCSLFAATLAALTVAVSAHAWPAAQRSGAAPRVQSMVVGAGGTVLSGARNVSAAATTVRVGAKSCAVAAGTPLSVLAALRRAGGPSFALRDYGRCGSSPRNSGQLFIYALGGERNRGADGWEYKVDGVSGSTGAGDPSGPMGDGRTLRPGSQVLWFWCVAFAGGCQRTLHLAVNASTVSRGGSLSTTVTGYDNEGRVAPVAGAIVTLGTDFASTGAGGRATLLAPSVPGPYAVSARKSGLVESFPLTIVVR